MEQFIVSARKYRPTTFEDVVGQRAITKTLENAIANNHLAQALLFTGPRGVGKTTCARILAKRINEGDTQQTDEDFAFNIFELDAASNNSVDDIRNLTDQVRIPPQVGNYKVYIIDEVHMLSTQAFNAFLKTLEEPPRHAIFILATTEKHKIIPTILSRCQIFDFKRINVQDIKEHLAKIALTEGIDAEDDALHIIAQKADGALRDALSTFDRVVSFSGKKLTREAVTENLNVLDYNWFFQITDLLLENNIPEVLLTYNSILSKGFDGHHFIMGLGSHFRDLLVSHNPETIPLLEVGEQVKAMYLEQSKKASKEFLIQGIDLTNSCDLNFRNSQNQRLLVELCLMQLASLTFEGQKKKYSPSVKAKKQIVPPSYFKSEAHQSKASGETKSTEATPSVNRVQEPQAKPEPAEATTQNTVVEEEVPTSQPTHIEGQKETEPRPAEPTKKVGLEIAATAPVSALSIRSIQEKQKLKQEALANQKQKRQLPTDSFTQEEMVTAWNAYAKIVEKQGKYNLLSHLTMNTPVLKGDIIHLEFPNQTIKKELEFEKTKLLQYLRKKLNNHQIDLDIVVNETVKKKYAYSPREKYEQLAKTNPLLDRLKDEFGLNL